MELTDRLAQLETLIGRLQAEIAVKDAALIAQAERIAHLEGALEEQRRGREAPGGTVLQGQP